MDDPRPPTRVDLARFIQDQRTLRAFEQLFKVVPGEFNVLAVEIEKAKEAARRAYELAGSAMMQAGEAVNDDQSPIGFPKQEAATGGGSAVSGEVIATLPSAAGVIAHTETIAAPNVLPSMRVQIQPATHNDSDENDVTMLAFQAMSAQAGAGSVTVTLAFAEPTAGPIRLNYLAV